LSGDLKISGNSVISLEKYKIYERNLKRRKQGLEEDFVIEKIYLILLEGRF